MTNNILKEEILVTLRPFLKEVYPNWGKCLLNAAEVLSCGIFSSGSTVLADIARILKPDSLRPDKELMERCSEWLGRGGKKGEEDKGFLPGLNNWLSERFLKSMPKDTGIAFDNSDISKEYGGEGMEGMEFGHDGSSKTQNMGHLFSSATLLANGQTIPKPVYLLPQKGKHKPLELFKSCIKKVMTDCENKAIGVIDREGDAIDFLWWLLDNNYRMVIRIRIERDWFGTGNLLNTELEHLPWVKNSLIRLQGKTIEAHVRCKVGYLPPPNKPTKDEQTQYRKVLIVQSKFADKTINLCMLLPEEEFQDPEKLLKRAKQAAQLYLNRWQIEQSFRVVKQHFGLEKLRVRTYIRLVNILALCYLCHVFNHFILPAAENSAKVTKIVKDNFHDIISHPIAMLNNIRTLIVKQWVYFVSGRPKKSNKAPPKATVGPVQMKLSDWYSFF